jgi:hypothetical protein
MIIGGSDLQAQIVVVVDNTNQEGKKTKGIHDSSKPSYPLVWKALDRV